MATRITDTEMTSDKTRHKAELVKLPSPLTGYSWQVTWLPGQHLARDQAITAMTIAEVVRTHADDLADNGSRWWLHIDGWAAELGITGPHAVAEASLSPEDHQVPRGQWPSADVLPVPRLIVRRGDDRIAWEELSPDERADWWHAHRTGPHAVAEASLSPEDHAATDATFYRCCVHCTHQDMDIPADQHTRPCPEGCNDSEVAR